MIRHEAVDPDLDAAFVAPFGHQVDMGLVIIIEEEDFLTTITALCDVMWESGATTLAILAIGESYVITTLGSGTDYYYIPRLCRKTKGPQKKLYKSRIIGNISDSERS